MREPQAVVPLSPVIYEPVVRRGLEEDLGRAGDLTTDALIPIGHESAGLLVARVAGRICGVQIALSAFRCLDETLELEALVPEGAEVSAGEALARVSGSTRAILSAERTALNLLGRLSGIASATSGLVHRVAGSGARIACTRKTTPGLRALEKYAVRVGGGSNHRFGLDDSVLIKDNHLVAVDSIEQAVERARESCGHWVRVEVEVDTLDQLEEALATDVDAVLLDNMPLDELEVAVGLCRGRALTEASGGVTAQTVGAIAATGVDVISVGWLTHSAPALDVALDLTD